MRKFEDTLIRTEKDLLIMEKDILKYCKVREYVQIVSRFLQEEEKKKSSFDLHQLQQKIDQKLPNIFFALTKELQLNTLAFAIILLVNLNIDEEMISKLVHVRVRFLSKTNSSVEVLSYLEKMAESSKKFNFEWFIFLGRFCLTFVFVSMFSFIFINSLLGNIIPAYHITLIFSFIITMIVYRIVQHFRFLYRNRKYNGLYYLEDFIIYRFTVILLTIGTYEFLNSFARKNLLDQIREIAYLIGVEYPRCMTANDLDMERKFVGIGNYIYSLGTWVVFPKRDTEEHFTREMLKILDMFLQNDWDSLSVLAIEFRTDIKNFKRKRFLQNFLDASRKIFTASIPLIVVILLRIILLSFFEVTFESALDLLLVGTSLYFVTQLLFLLKPDFDKDIEKTTGVMENVKNLSSFISFK